MWTCPLCNRLFVRNNQLHSCNDKTLADFLTGRSDYTVGLFYHLVNEFQHIGEITVRPTKSMIALSATTGFAYVIQLGKNFIDVVLPFKEPYQDNLCFNKIKPVPGSDDFNHHLRLYSPEDINDEVRAYMEMAYKNGC